MVTIKDIATELRLSHSVVSRALNPNPDKNARVSEETRKQIIVTAERMGFKRNRIAEFMKRGRAATIGVFLPEYSNRLLADLMIGISETAAEDGFPLNFYFGRDYATYEKFIRQSILYPGSGIISYPFNIQESTKIEDLFLHYLDAGGKVLLLNTSGNRNIPVLYMDEQHGGRLAAECLAGHHCAAYLLDNGYMKRTESCRAWLQEHEPSAPCIGFSVNEFSDVFSAARKQFNNQKLGIFSVSDVYAAGFIKIIKASGAEFGKDIVLTGYDDLQLTGLLDPPLTTIHQPFRQQGHQAVEKLISMIYENPEQDEAIKPFLVRRETA